MIGRKFRSVKCIKPFQDFIKILVPVGSVLDVYYEIVIVNPHNYPFSSKNEMGLFKLIDDDKHSDSKIGQIEKNQKFKMLQKLFCKY